MIPVSMMKEMIQKGLERFVNDYRAKEKDKYRFDIDGCELICDENGYKENEKKIDNYYDKNKVANLFKDKLTLIYSGICTVSILILVILTVFFSPVILTIGIMTGLAGSFLLWRRIVDLGRIRKEKKRKGKLLLKQALEELAQWRKAYKEADSKAADMISAIGQF